MAVVVGKQREGDSLGRRAEGMQLQGLAVGTPSVLHCGGLSGST